MQAFSNVSSTLILFVGVVLATALLVSALSLSVKSMEQAVRERTNVEAERTYTYFKIVEGGGDTVTGLLWAYVKNIGQTSLDVNGFTVFVNRRFVGTCNNEVNCVDEDGDFVLQPGELMEINVPGVVSAIGTYDLKVVAENGVYDTYTVVVG